LVVYSKEPSGGSEQVLRFMARYTHRVATSNSRLVAIDDGVSFKWKDYRVDVPARIKVMTLTPGEFIRRFLIHVLPHPSLRALRQKPAPAQPRTSAATTQHATSASLGRR
jgi:hypothetical protein